MHSHDLNLYGTWTCIMLVTLLPHFTFPPSLPSSIAGTILRAVWQIFNGIAERR